MCAAPKKSLEDSTQPQLPLILAKSCKQSGPLKTGAGPSGSVASESESHHPSEDQVFIQPAHQLPLTCITAGKPTQEREQ